MKFTLNITQKHIDDAMAMFDNVDGTNCPVARALIDAGFQFPHVFDNFNPVTGQWIDEVVSFKDKDGWEHEFFSEHLKNWADNFDDGEDVFPLKMEIEIENSFRPEYDK